MAQKVSQVLKNKLPSSSAEYTIESTRSDGRLPDRQKPATKADHKIHLTHIKDSGQYNLRHSHDHLSELVFDYQRLSKEDLRLAAELQSRTLGVLNKQFTKMGLRLERKKK
jgi:hypothetical protein